MTITATTATTPTATTTATAATTTLRPIGEMIPAILADDICGGVANAESYARIVLISGD